MEIEMCLYIQGGKPGAILFVVLYSSIICSRLVD